MHNINAIYIIWKREMLRWWRDKTRILGSLGFPLIFLLVFGSGLSGAMGPLVQGAGASAGNVDFKQFIFPGVIAMNVFFAAIFSGVSVVYDREFGIMKEVLVAPINRASVAIGKTLGGATVATLQGTLVFVFAPIAGITFKPVLFIQLWPIMFIGAFAMTSMGVAIASRMRSTEGFQVINQFITFPMIFLSGAFFPLQGLPTWMEALVKINPMTYAVDPLRRLMFESQNLPPTVLEQLSKFGLGIEVFGHQLTVWHDLAIVIVFGAIMNSTAMYLFSRQD